MMPGLSLLAAGVAISLIAPGDFAVIPLTLVMPTDDAPTVNGTPGSDIEFHIHTRLNPVSPTVVDVNSSSPLVDTSSDLVIILHGFTGSVASKSVVLIRNALLYELNVTVVAVQWARLARGPWYDEAAGNTEIVARHLSNFLLDQEANGLDLERVHIIGFSLGAHVAGFTGSLLDGRLGRITGLDPARPGFDTRNSSGRLDAGDAHFVVGLHTGAGFVALPDPVGHVDFYPNGGSKQPHCLGEDIPLVCNHFMAYTYFAESIYNGKAFPAFKCSSWEDFDGGLCDANEMAFMGYHTPNTTRGLFYLRTNAQEPFGLGQASHRVDLDISQVDSSTVNPHRDSDTLHGRDMYSVSDRDSKSEVHSLNDLDSTTHLPNNSCKFGVDLMQVLLFMLLSLSLS